jgi:hypothetical protein
MEPERIDGLVDRIDELEKRVDYIGEAIFRTQVALSDAIKAINAVKLKNDMDGNRGRSPLTTKN